jgi:flagellar motor switch protein FliG
VTEALVPARARERRPAPAAAPALRPEDLPSPIEKAAIILTAIGPELGAGFLRGLAASDLQRLARTLTALGRVRQEVLDAVIMQFVEALTAGPGVAGGSGPARKLLAGVLDADDLARLFDGVRDVPRPVWERLADSPAAPLAAFLAAEHPQAAAVILSELKPELAAAVLERLDRGLAQTLVLRLSRAPVLGPAAAAALRDGVEAGFLAARQADRGRRRPADLIAGLMNNVSAEARDGFLGHLEAQEPALARDVARTMFTWDDVPARLNPRDVPMVLRDVPEDVLLRALRHGQDQGGPTPAFLLESLPRRLAERYAEDLAALPAASPQEGEAAQMEIARAIQAQARAGQIRLADPPGEG